MSMSYPYRHVGSLEIIKLCSLLCTSKQVHELVRSILGTLRSDNSDANENVAEEQTLRPLKFYRPYVKSPSHFERREVRLEMKRGDRVPAQREIAKFIALPFQFSRQLKFGHFKSWLCRDSKLMYNKSLMQV